MKKSFYLVVLSLLLAGCLANKVSLTEKDDIKLTIHKEANTSLTASMYKRGEDFIISGSVHPLSTTSQTGFVEISIIEPNEAQPIVLKANIKRDPSARHTNFSSGSFLESIPNVPPKGSEVIVRYKGKEK